MHSLDTVMMHCLLAVSPCIGFQISASSAPGMSQSAVNAWLGYNSEIDNLSLSNQWKVWLYLKNSLATTVLLISKEHGV